MQTPHRPFYHATAALPLLLISLLLIGCGDSDPGYEHTYTVRAIVYSLPSDNTIDEFRVHHERIDDYQSINGSVGMNEMIMPIPVPDRSVLQGIAVGDKVELTFGERFEPDHRMGVISVVKLPDDTELELNQPTDASETAADEPPAPSYEHIYTVRALVHQLPSENRFDELYVHHEVILDYQSPNGPDVLNEMIMPIIVPDHSLLEGIAVGDKVELTFGQRFEPDREMGLISIVKLPADTELNLGKSSKPGKN